MADAPAPAPVADPVVDDVPLPDNIADVELTGLNPTPDSTEPEQVEPGQEEPTQDPPSEEEPAPAVDPEPEEPEEPGDKPKDPAEKEPEQPEPKPAEDPEAAQRQHNAEMAQQRIEAKKQRDFVGEQRAAIRAYEQENDTSSVEEQVKVIKAQQYVDTVERNQRSLVTENAQAQAVIPLFNPQAPEFNQKLYTRALQQFNDNYVVTDPDTGAVLGAQDRSGNNVSLFQYLQQEAAVMSDILGTTSATAQRQTQSAEAKMRAKAVNPQTPGKVTSSGDEIDDLFEKVKDIPLVP